MVQDLSQGGQTSQEIGCIFLTILGAENKTGLHRKYIAIFRQIKVKTRKKASPKISFLRQIFRWELFSDFVICLFSEIRWERGPRLRVPGGLFARAYKRNH